MSIKTKTITAIAGAAAIASTGTIAHAEEVQTQPTTDSSVVTTADQTAKQSSTVSQSDVDQAKAKLDAANTDLETAKQSEETAKSQLEDATKSSETAKTEVDKAQELADKASDKEVKKAEDAVKDSTIKVDEAKKSQSDAEAAKTKADDAVKDQQSKTDAAKKTVNEKQQIVDDAKSGVENAEDALKGTGLPEALDAQKQAKSDAEAAKTKLDQANQDLDQAKKDAADRQSKIDAAKAKRDAAESESETKDAKLDAAKSVFDQKNSEFKEADSAYKVADDAVTNANKIDLGSDFLNALKEYIALDKEFQQAIRNGATYNDFKDRFKAAREKVLKYNTKVQDINQYHASAKDEANKTVYDVNNLPEDVKEDLSLFGADLINQMRRAVGMREVKSTTSSIKFANEVADEYVKANFSWDDAMALSEAGGAGHYAKGINNVARRHGFATTSAKDEALGWQYYENKTMIGGPYSPTYLAKGTISQIKERIYSSIVDFVGTTGDTAHMFSVLGFSDNDKQVYFGLAVSHPGDAFNVHAITGLTEDVVAKDPSFSTTSLANPYDLADLATKRDAAKVTRDAAETAKNDAERKYETAKSEAEVAQYNFDRAKDELAVAEAVKDRTAEAQDAANKAQAKFDAAEAALKKANDKVTALTAGVEEKKANLQKAKDALTAAEAELKDAQTKLTAEQTKLAEAKQSADKAAKDVETAKTTVKDAEAELTAAKAHLEDLKNAPKILAAAKAKFEAAEKVLKEAKAKFEAAEKALKDAEAKQSAAKEDYDKVFNAYSEYVRAQQELIRQRQLKEEYERIQREGKKSIAIVDGTGKVTKYVEDKVLPKTDNHSNTVGSKSIQALTAAKSDKQSDKRSLPATGTETSSLGVLGVMLAAVAVMFGLKRKEEN